MGLQFLVVTCLVALPPALGDCASVFLQPKALGGLQFIEKGFTKTENFEHIGLLLLFLLTLEGLCLRKFSSVQCCCRSKETLTRTIRDKEPRTATSAFTQLLSSCVYIYIFRVCFWGLLPWGKLVHFPRGWSAAYALIHTAPFHAAP